MKLIYLLFFSVIMQINTVYAGVGNEDLEAIIKLTDKGKYKKALEKHIWFHEESKTSPGMGGVRLSFAIEYWLQLARKYPPALDALKNIRDRNKNLLFTGKGEFQNFHDLSSINEKLGQEKHTYEAFLILDKKYPEQAKSYYHVIEDFLIKNKEYGLCGKYLGDPIYKYENLRHTRDLSISFSKSSPELITPEYLVFNDEYFIDGVLGLIKILVALDRKEEAKDIQQKALAYFENETIKNAIQ